MINQAQQESRTFMKTLLETPSPAGFEEAGQALVRKRLADVTDKVITDVFGNVIGVRNPQGNPSIMLAAHCDEIGVMLTYINDDGFLYFQKIGGPHVRRLEGLRVSILTAHGTVPGVIARKNSNLGDADAAVKIHELWIDIGVESKARAEALVSAGDPIVFDAPCTALDGNLVMARGMDDRIGVYVLVETMRALHKQDLQAAVYCASTAQEEAGSRGARSCTYTFDPQIGITVDVIETSDYPDCDKRITGDIRLGRGPVLSKGANFNPRLSQLLVEVAKEQDIPYQFIGTPMPTWTDANVMQTSRNGLATALVEIPLRYMHSPGEIVSLADIDGAIALLAALIKKLAPEMDFTP